MVPLVVSPALTRAATRVSPALVALALAVPALAMAVAYGWLPSPGSPLVWLGLAGPMTGTTRAWLALFHGDMAAAFAWNPLFWFWGGIVALAYIDLWRLALRGPLPGGGYACVLVTLLRRHRVLGPFCLGTMLATLFWQNLPWSLVGSSLGQ